jgi:hypothetical protein
MWISTARFAHGVVPATIRFIYQAVQYSNMKPLSKVLLLANAFLLSLIPLVSSGSECRLLTEASVIAHPGRYCLAKGILVSEYGVRINSSNVDLDLQGHSIEISKKTDGLTIGIAITDNVKSVKIHNGGIDGAIIGINVTAGTAISVEKMSLKNIGAIGINAVADKIEIRNTTISNVGIKPLDKDNAYAIGINLGSKDALVSDCKISDVRRQSLEPNITGEPVGILVTSSCGNCVITGNELNKGKPEVDSYGVWNAALGKVYISKNKVSGFRNGIVSAGHQVSISGNTLVCKASGAQSVGLFSLARDFKKSDSFISSSENTMTDCSMEYLSCMGLQCENQAFDSHQLGKRVFPSRTK